MGRWPVVQKQKEQNAKERGKVFAIHAKLIALAAQRWADPTENASLAEAISSAKKANVPNENIERAIARGSGTEKGALQIEEVYYEGYGPGGVAIIAKALTDNRNRTAPNVRHIFSKYGGSLGETGSVSNFAFKYRGIICFENVSNTEAFETALLETEAEDYEFEETEAGSSALSARVICDVKKLAAVSAAMSAAGFVPESRSLEYLPISETEVGEFDKAFKVHRLVSELENDDDIESVWHTAAISDDMVEEILAAIESTRFRT